MKKQCPNLRYFNYLTYLVLLLFSLSCSKSSVEPDSSVYFIATIDGKEINFDNYVKAQINTPKQVSLSNPYSFLIEANKVSGGNIDLLYLTIDSQLPIKATTYDNSIRPNDVWFLGVGGTPPANQNIPTASKVTITFLSDTFVEGTFYGEVYPKGDINNKKIIIKDGKFRVSYKK